MNENGAFSNGGERKETIGRRFWQRSIPDISALHL